jgi:hypothetical protein
VENIYGFSKLALAKLHYAAKNYKPAAGFKFLTWQHLLNELHK